MQTNYGPVYALSSKNLVQTAHESYDLHMDFCGFKQLRVMNSLQEYVFTSRVENRHSSVDLDQIPLSEANGSGCTVFSYITC